MVEPGLIVRYAPNNRVAVAARVEFYKDENGVIIATRTPNGFKTVGYSVNLDYKVKENMLWRIEGRGFQSKDDIFTTDDETSSQNHVFTTALALSF